MTVDYRIIQALVQVLPQDGIWTEKTRDAWVKAMETSIDYCFEIVPDDRLIEQPYCSGEVNNE